MVVRWVLRVQVRGNQPVMLSCWQSDPDSWKFQPDFCFRIRENSRIRCRSRDWRLLFFLPRSITTVFVRNDFLCGCIQDMTALDLQRPTIVIRGAWSQGSIYATVMSLDKYTSWIAFKSATPSFIGFWNAFATPLGQWNACRWRIKE